MEDLGSWYGMVLYSLSGASFAASSNSYSSKTVHDRMQVFVDGTEADTAYRAECPTTIKTPAGTSMDLLVENMGRINYGRKLCIADHKGYLAPPPVAAKASCPSCCWLLPLQMLSQYPANSP
jgi:hypothetical protein